MNFYSVIIGSELLNGRREDAHFKFLNQELLKRGWEHKANFVIRDDPILMQNVYELIKKDEKSVMFSFGGIGATPDDLTREVASKAFGDGKLYTHKKAEELIINQFKEKAYPHRINMAKLPKGAKLLKNVVNNVPGFQLEDRFFFTPGFPEMARSMVIEALDNFYPKNRKKFRKTFIAKRGENDFISLMQQVPKTIEFSSLPKFIGDKRETEISFAGEDREEILKEFEKFINYMNEKKIEYKIME